jgi:hypothetical protein
MYTITAFFSSHFIGSHRRSLLCPFIPLFLVLMLFVAMPLEAQAAVPDAVDRVNELHAMAPTVEDLLRQDEGRWSLKRGVGNSVFLLRTDCMCAAAPPTRTSRI